MNEGARRGFLYALMIGLGAVAMEVIYCALAFTGFAALFTGETVKRVMEVGSFVFMLYLGIRFLTVRTVHAPTNVETRITTQFHPHAAFAIGFVRVMANPGVFLFWIFLGIYFINHTWVMPTLISKGACVAGVALGTSLWFFGLSYAVSLGHRNFTNKTLLRMERGSGIGLLGLALIHGVQILWEMHKHKI